MDTVCTEREGASSSSSTGGGGGGGVGASTRKALAGAKSRLQSTFQSLSSEVAAGWREVEEEYAQQAQAQQAQAQQAQAAKLAYMRRMQEVEQQQRMRMAQEQQPSQAAGGGGVATANRGVFQQFLDVSGQYEEDDLYAEEDDEEWETESCPERWIDIDESLWDTMSL